MSVLPPKIEAGIALLPHSPGVYLMKDADERIIYIGKAKNLYRRVSQYFLRPQSGKVAAMVSHVDHFDFIIVHSDKEAFILEINLIQTHYPRYNIMLMDDSHYPYIALKRHGDPLLKIARNTKDGNYFYFGPFPSSSSCYETIDLLNKIFPTRKCRTIPKKPCIYYSMGQCLAPCLRPLESEVAEKLYNDIKRFLNGDTAETKAMLRKKMELAAEKLDFETASSIKKTIDSLDYVTDKQNVELPSNLKSADVFAFSKREGYFSLSILTYRRGLLLGKQCHVVAEFGEAEEEAIELILQYYQNHELPKIIIARINGLAEEIQSVYEGVDVVFPEEGRMMDMVSIASLNAQQGLDQHFMTARLQDDSAALLDELGSILNIKTPYRIELFDNSHVQGASAVGAMVCFINGKEAKKLYRKFDLPDEVAGDDYHSMVHVVRRRYARIKEEKGEFPDLILTDGGITQVHAALEALAKIDVQIPVYGLYKNDKHQTSGLIDSDGKTYELDRKSPLFFMLMRMQDEVHRYAISFHQQKRGKSMFASIFDDIQGIGSKRRAKLEERYRDMDSLLSASVSELAQLLPIDAAEALYAKLHPES